MKLKNILARELLIIMISAIIVSAGIFIDYIFEQRDNKNEYEYNLQLNDYESQIDIYYSNFRKQPRVDSLIKLQMTFYNNYIDVFQPNSKIRNYHFWIDVRRSIYDSTFNFTYASDPVIKTIVSPDYYYEKRKLCDDLMGMLRDHKMKRTGRYLVGDLDSVKNEFKLFALSIDFERYISKDVWKDYTILRKKHQQLLESESGFQKNDPLQYTYYALFFCLVFIFGLRYMYYLIKWSIRNLN
jgi:hypothetical protein